ncbi:unnamed protein product [Caenorhabditis bovis]|uniref:Ribonuclease H1 n=1 Tax=Caenorhabditis bovis TaxID=2654633 RepID=A0A8S1FEI3_9PELO|nr:unnamed protein product [Caenorhabditis bovis]
MGKSDNYYAVARGRTVGIFRSWNECKAQVDGFQMARYKKFGTESEALQFIADNRCVATSQPAAITKSQEQRPSRKRALADVKPLVVPLVKKAKIDLNELAIWNGAPVVYTDGACSNNGKVGAKAGWGVYWGDGHDDNEFGPVYGEPTNNRGELIAVEKALEKAIEKKIPKIIVRTDSNLLIQSLDKWIIGWKRKGWKTSGNEPVKNRDLLEKIDQMKSRIKVKFEHVRGHSGVHGNEMADELARRGAKMYKN